MVRSQDNTLRVEVGFGISYQWAIDAETAAREAVSKFYAGTKETVHAASSTVKSSITSAVDHTTTAGHKAVVTGRDRAAAALLGIPVDSLDMLRQLAINPPALASASGKRATARLKSEVAVLAVPKDGAAVDAGQFRTALQAVSRAADAKSAWPILNNVLIEQVPEGMKLTCFDLELGITQTIPAAFGQFAPFTVPVKDLIKALSSAKGAVNMTFDGEGVAEFTSGGSSVKLLTLPAEEYRPLPAIENPVWHSGEGLIDSFNTVMAATSPDEPRPILTGVLLTPTQSVATDTHRLHIAKHPALALTEDVIIPRRTCEELARLFGGKKPIPFQFAIDGLQIHFQSGDTRMVSRLIEGQFPNWLRVIPGPEDFAGSWTFDGKKFTEAVRSVSVFAKDNANRIILQETEIDGAKSLQISAHSGDTGESVAHIPLLGGGFDKQIAFNTAYITEAVSSMTDADHPSAMMELHGSLKAATVTADGLESSDRQAIVMPMQIL